MPPAGTSDPFVDVVIVGAGHNGLCAAAILARAGLEVLVLERRARVGGACATEEIFPGYRFSTCAYALHMLHERVVAETGVRVEVIPFPARAALLPDGTVRRDDDATPWDAAARAVDARLVGEPPSLTDLRAELGGFADASIVEVVERAWADPRDRAALAPRYFDGSPHAPGSALAYAYFEAGNLRPRWLRGLPAGGMGAVADAFATAATQAGARVLTSCDVVRLDAGGAEAAGGRRFRARVVLSAVDPVRTAALAGVGAPRLVMHPRAAKLHLALRSRPDLSPLIGADDPATLGLVHVYADWDWYRRAHQAPEASYVELQLPTLLDPSLAPPGCHVLTAYLPFAGGDVRRLMWRAIDRAIPDARAIAVGEELRTPDDFERLLGLTNGHIHHAAHVPGQMFDRRPRFVGGIRLCGAGTHPGGEVSGLPGLNAARAVLAEMSA